MNHSTSSSKAFESYLRTEMRSPESSWPECCQTVKLPSRKRADQSRRSLRLNCLQVCRILAAILARCSDQALITAVIVHEILGLQSLNLVNCFSFSWQQVCHSERLKPKNKICLEHVALGVSVLLTKAQAGSEAHLGRDCRDRGSVAPSEGI